MNTWWSILTRRKRLEPVSDNSIYSSDKKLSRILSTFDLTALGVGSTLGVGVYVIAGQVSKDLAGPSVILSFLIAAVASVFAGLCYAEFGARVPKAGSAYNYSYICVGELIAFIIGWNLILEYVIGSASVARGLSLYVDTLVNNTLKDTFREIAPMDSSFLSEYFDFFAFAITMILGIALAFGLKESSIANNIFTIINICVVLFVIIAGAFKADGKNWRIAKKDIPDGVNGGEGGFFPFGIAGTIKGAATCFYGFVGFDCIATTAEEVKNPRKAVPIAIILSLFIVFLSYFGTSAIVTLMCPYYLQDPDAPIPHAFEEMGWTVAKWIVSIGGIFGLCASLFGAMFPLPRIVYAMASDALVFRFLGRIHDRFGTLVIGTLLAALLTGLMSAVFNLKQLVNMMSIGTLMAYTIVAACVIILRYDNKLYDDTEITEDLNLISPKQAATFGKVCKQLFNFSNRKPTYITQKIVTVQVFVFSILSLIFAAFMAYLQEDIQSENLWVIIPTVITFFLMLLTLVSIYAQPNSNKALTFQVPFVPLIPAISIAINLYLMMMLDANTWIRFAVWMAVGFPIYIACCILYKRTPKKPEQIIRNGHISHVYTNQDNMRALTIPKIIIDPPANGNLKLENHFQTKSATEEKDTARKYSIDITEVNKAVYELDKVLNDTEESYDSYENVEAINETEKLKRNTFKDNDNHSIISTDSESAKSEEHHVEAIVHQEDELCEKSEVNKKNDERCEKREENKKDDELLKKGEESKKEDDFYEEIGGNQMKDELSEKKEDESDKQHETHEEIKHNEENVEKENNEKETPKKIHENTSLEENIEENHNEVEPSQEVSKNEQDKMKKESNNAQIPDVSEICSHQEEPSEPKPFIPVPPPISGLVIEPLNYPFPHPKTKRRAPLPPLLKLEEISLRPTPKSTRTRSESVASDESEDNAKIGTEKYQRVKAKLEEVFKNYKPLKLGGQKYYFDDKTPSPVVVKEIELLEKILEPYEEIPADYSKTKEFKDTLSKLLSKKTTRVESFQYVRKYEKNSTVITEEQKKRDEIKHRRMMNDTLRSIKLRKTGLLQLEKEKESQENNTEDDTTKYDESNQMIITKKIEVLQKIEINKENKNTNQRKNSELDQEKHKRLMIATLRSIKLRKTGISLSETDNDDTNSKEETGR